MGQYCPEYLKGRVQHGSVLSVMPQGTSATRVSTVRNISVANATWVSIVSNASRDECNMGQYCPEYLRGECNMDQYCQ